MCSFARTLTSSVTGKGGTLKRNLYTGTHFSFLSILFKVLVIEFLVTKYKIKMQCNVVFFLSMGFRVT